MIFALLSLSAAAQWQPLFNGKDLAGWTQLNGTATYEVQGKEIVGKTVVGSPNSFLCTDKVYGDFEFEFEVKVDPMLNSGMQIRSHSVPGYNNGRVHGYQIEVDPTGRGWSGGLYEEAKRGWLQDLSKNEKASKAYKNGDWNKFRVVTKGNHIQSWVNGVKAADHKDDMSIYGFIGLQIHSNEVAGREVRWRNMRIKDNGLWGATPPKGGKWLLRGDKDRVNWVTARERKPNPWTWVDGGLQSSGGDIITAENFGDSRFHVEFMTDDNGQTGQGNGNSGVYMGESHEVQVLNSAPRGPLDNECGAIYSVKAPDFAMAFKPYQWQAYDIIYTLARWEGDKKIANAQLTVYHNGVLVHKDVEVPRATAAGREEMPGARPLRLQDHGNKVKYRNIWVAPK